MEKNTAAKKIKVRIVKKPLKKKAHFEKKEPLKEKITKFSAEEERKKKLKIIFAVGIILAVIFVFWLFQLDNTFSRIDRKEQSFWQKIITDLKDEFNDITSSFEDAKSNLSNQNESGIDEEIEESIFPEIK